MSVMRSARNEKASSEKISPFPAAGSLQFVATSILSPLSKVIYGDKHVTMLMDRLSESAWATTVTTVTPTNAATVFGDNFIIQYLIPTDLLTKKRPQFVPNFFAAVKCRVCFKILTITVYYPQTNSQVQCSNRAIVARLQHYFAEHHSDWDGSAQPLTYQYSSEVSQSISRTPFSLVQTHQSSGPLALKPANALPGDIT